MKEFTYQDYLIYEKIYKNNIKKIFNFSIWQMLSYKNVLHDVSVEYEPTTKNKEKKIIHEHDKIFKLILDDNQQMANLINDTLKLRNKLTKDDIQKYKSSYITEEFQNRELDVVYKMKDRNIFFLIEHQTKIDYAMPKRILEYEVAIIKSVLDKNIRKNSKLPKVIPIVVYTGKRKWNAKKYIEECQEKLEDAEPLKMGQYYVIDINDYNEKEMIETEQFLYKAFLIEKSKNSEELFENLKKIIAKETAEKNKELLKRMIYFIYQERLGKEKTEELLEKIGEGGREDMVIEMLRKEKKDLISQGISQGITQATEKIIMQMIKLKMNDDIIKKVTQISTKELEEIKTRIS